MSVDPGRAKFCICQGAKSVFCAGMATDVAVTGRIVLAKPCRGLVGPDGAENTEAGAAGTDYLFAARSSRFAGEGFKLNQGLQLQAEA